MASISSRWGALPRGLRRLLALVGSLAFVLAAGCEQPEPPRTVVAYVGAGKGTASVNVFFPSVLHIRAGDTVTWRMNADGDPHTVTFSDTPETITDIISVPSGEPFPLMFNPQLLLSTRESGEPVETYEDSGYFNSGIFFGAVRNVPVLNSYSLRFTKPGSYTYVCGIHDYMKATVLVEDAQATPPEQTEIDQQAQKEADPYLQTTGYNQQLIQTRRVFDQEAGPDGTSVWIVSAGVGPREAEVVDFHPKTLTVKEGDTVVWTSSAYHSIVFDPLRPLAQFYLPGPATASPPVVGVNSEAVVVTKPSAYYDGTAFVSSGLIGPNVRWIGIRPAGVGFSLTFPKAGVYSYVCPIHVGVGMTGSVTVVPR